MLTGYLIPCLVIKSLLPKTNKLTLIVDFHFLQIYLSLQKSRIFVIELNDYSLYYLN